MKQRILNVLWIIVFLTTIVFWFFIYKAAVSEYDLNFAYLILAVLTSIFTTPILIYVSIKDKQKNSFKKFTKIFTLVLGTPIAVFLLWLYGYFILMREVSISSNNKYEMHKAQNYFKTQNMLIQNYHEINPDTLVSVISKDNTIKKIYKIKNGKKQETTIHEIVFSSEEEKDDFTTY